MRSRHLSLLSRIWAPTILLVAAVALASCGHTDSSTATATIAPATAAPATIVGEWKIAGKGTGSAFALSPYTLTFTPNGKLLINTSRIIGNSGMKQHSRKPVELVWSNDGDLIKVVDGAFFTEYRPQFSGNQLTLVQDDSHAGGEAGIVIEGLLFNRVK